jgi:hypothetical protein
MFRRLPKRSLWSLVVRAFGPPPPPPRRHFSKLWSPDARPAPTSHVTRGGSGSEDRSEHQDRKDKEGSALS